MNKECYLLLGNKRNKGIMIFVSINSKTITQFCLVFISPYIIKSALVKVRTLFDLLQKLPGFKKLILYLTRLALSLLQKFTTMENFESLIVGRRSTRKFTAQQISPEDVQKLLQSALLAPSAKNGKSWEFVAVEDKNMIKQLSVCKNSGGAFLDGCALAIVVLGNKTITDIWIEDASIAATYIQLQAEDLNIGSCWCHVRDRFLGEMSSEQYVRDMLDIPDNFGVLCIIGLGHKTQGNEPKDLSNIMWEKVHIGSFKTYDDHRPLMA